MGNPLFLGKFIIFIRKKEQIFNIMAKKVKMTEFRKVVRRVIKEEKQKLDNSKLDEGLIRQIIKEEMEDMYEMDDMDDIMMTEQNATLSVQFPSMNFDATSPEFKVSPLFQGKVMQSKGSRIMIELNASTPDYQSKSASIQPRAMQEKAKEILMKYIKVDKDGLFIDPRVAQGVPMAQVDPTKITKLKDMYMQTKDSDPARANRIKQALMLAQNKLRWTIKGTILVPTGVRTK